MNSFNFVLMSFLYIKGDMFHLRLRNWNVKISFHIYCNERNMFVI